MIRAIATAPGTVVLPRARSGEVDPGNRCYRLVATAGVRNIHGAALTGLLTYRWRAPDRREP
ncbi:MAG: hypothetical protein ABSA93_05985 [Streptosporangiaceae bacterium]